MIIEKLKQSIETVVHKLWPEAKVDFTVEHPEVEERGDYASNVAMVLAKQVKQAPMVVAERIVEILKQESLPEVASIEALKPGFINFRLADSFLYDAVAEIEQKGDTFGNSQTLAGQKILIEFGQPNTHKMPHIGHLFSYLYGESCARLLGAAGAEVKKANYQGDVGLHVAKCLWAYQNTETEQAPATLEDKVTYLQQCYQQGSKAYEDSQIAHAEIDHLNDKIYHRAEDIRPLWEQTREWSLSYYRQFESSLGIIYDKHYFESQVAAVGLETVKQNVGPVFEASEGAIVFKGEPFGLHTRVFVNHFGNPTYEAKDLGLMSAKKADWPGYQLVITTATEQNDYWRILTLVGEKVFPDLIGKIRHLGFGMISLTSGKMSSREGTIVTAFDLVRLVTEKVQAFLDANRADYSSEEKQTITRPVALAAIIYSYLKKGPSKNLVFDIDSSIAFDGNSGPYLQYAYARCQSVLAKAREAGYDISLRRPTTVSSEEAALMRWLYQYPEVVSQAAEQYAPQLLCTYLYELAQRYSLFYDRQKMLIEDRDVAAFRLSLAQASGQVLKNGLNLLGISVLDKI